MGLNGVRLEVFGALTIIVSLTPYLYAPRGGWFDMDVKPTPWVGTEGGRYSPPVIGFAAQLSGIEPGHRPREDCRCAGGGRGGREPETVRRWR